MQIPTILMTLGYLATTAVAAIWTEELESPKPADGYLVNPNDGKQFACTQKVFCGGTVPSPAGSNDFTVERNACDQFYTDKSASPTLTGRQDLRCKGRNGGTPGID
ncbi:hypothetical protein HYFRA_00005407 [Hymenoscyphus fraxineus]|uniref:Uncharacterized protein n=1 Tax=Hymenoscyphus fraxineus TaxID=746836 RepID=A0A9N9PRM1_9HELO|nr:hypothetical protein HYFRA_00005407 [Hymenoscyphus fraxineus]